MELAEILQQWGPSGLMLVGLIYVFINGSKMQLAHATALSDSNKQWASIAGQQQRENEGLSSRINEHALQSTAQQARIVELSERLAAQEATNEIMERLHEKERATWIEKDEKSDRRIADLERSVADNKRTIETLTNASQQKDERITTLEAENAQLKVQVKRGEEYAASRDRELKEKRAELEAAEKKLQECEEQEQAPEDDDKTIREVEKPPRQKTG